ncbi:MAG: MerR family transcriptional regulator [Gemmatimonadetes bacterium]|nr:MerR family transcriptional regulator [Gemmatimonadota bacterium]
MDASPTPLDLPELADRAGVSIRTVRYYIQQGLLQEPEARGPGAHYTEEHLDRLLLIKRLQKEHLPLSEIRKAIQSGAAEAAIPRSARDYVRSVLGKASAPMQVSSPPMMQQPEEPVRSQWERITLAPDIELHLRRPLSRGVNKKVERLLDVARDIFEEDQ